LGSGQLSSAAIAVPRIDAGRTAGHARCLTYVIFRFEVILAGAGNKALAGESEGVK